jgi:hypothetical protein
MCAPNERQTPESGACLPSWWLGFDSLRPLLATSRGNVAAVGRRSRLGAGGCAVAADRRLRVLAQPVREQPVACLVPLRLSERAGEVGRPHRERASARSVAPLRRGRRRDDRRASRGTLADPWGVPARARRPCLRPRRRGRRSAAAWVGPPASEGEAAVLTATRRELGLQPLGQGRRDRSEVPTLA